jgi:RNA polymerase sigma factor (sigma-70 family)
MKNMEKQKLVELVTKAQNKDNHAMNELFNSFYNDVYYFALKTVKDEDIACDITQETFVEVINTISNLEAPAAFVTWLKQITYHQCTRYFKKKKDVLVDENEDETSIFETVQEDRAEFIPDEGLEQDEFKKTVLSIIDELTEEQRSAIMMYYFDELSVNEIAEIQGVSAGTVKSRLNYGRKAIKNSVEEFKKTVNRQSLVQGNDVPVHSSTVVLVLVYHDEISQVISLISPKIIDLPSLIQ